MKCIKKLVLIALLSTTSASDLLDYESNEEVLNDGGRRASPVEECFCLVRHPMMVPVVDYLDSEGHGLNRLVVYFYKDKKTGKLNAYIPGAENQRKFPDISLDLYGNEIFVVTEGLTVNAIFEKSKNVVPLTVSTKSPQGPEADGVHAEDPEIAPHQLLIYDFTNENQLKNTKPHTQTNTHTHPQIHTQTHPQTHAQINSQTYPHIHLQTHTQSHSQIIYPKSDINGPAKSSSIGGQFPYAYNSVNDNTVTDDSIQPSRSTHSPFDGILHYPTPLVAEVTDDSPYFDTDPVDTGISTNEGSWSTPAPANPARPFGDEDAISAKRVSAAFDAWFKGQIKRVRDVQLTAHYVLNVKTLKENVEKILHENHIKITANGKLQDSHGNIMSFSRLKLRPVLIGDSVGYEKVKHRENFVFPKDLTYLEAILISVSYPPKILGIVPLRKVTLPQILEKTQTIFKNVTSKNQTTYPATHTKTSKKNINNDNTHQKQILPHRQKGVKDNNKEVETVKKEYNITFNGAQGIPPVDLENVFGNPTHSKHKSSNKPKTSAETPVDGRKSLNSDEVEERADEDRNGNKKATGDIFKSLLRQTLGKLKYLFPISIPRKKVETEEETSTENPLGFRIIGGDPATISGNMLNSRGRSGFIY